MRALSWSLVGSLVLGAPAWAAPPAESPPAESPPAESPPAETPPPAVAVGVFVPDAAAEQAAFDHLAAGRFAAAAAAFGALAAESPDPTTRAWAARLAALSRGWHDGRMTLIETPPDDPDAAAARAERRRTTGEMAVLYVDGVLYGLGSGAWLAVLTDPKESAGAILPALALGGAVAGGLALADSKGMFGYGVPRSISAGLRLGLLEGALWTAWNQAYSHYYDEWSGEVAATVVWGATTAGAIIGGVVGDKLGATPGAASLVESAGLWSALVGALLAFGATADLSSGEADDIWLLTGALSLNVGAAAGAWLAADTAPAAARVRYLDLGGLSGGVLFGGLYLAFAGSGVDESALAVATAFGISGGIGTAWFLTRDMETDPFADPPAETVSLGLAPTTDGAILGLSGRW